MARRKLPDPKVEALRSRGCLNHRPEQVSDPLFAGEEFFDARDLVQVKYEMLRRARVEGLSVAASAAAFGFSRPTFYATQVAFELTGVEGLVPGKPGPRRAHKLSDEIVDFLEKQLAEGAAATPSDLAELVRAQFGRSVHARSVERALARRKKKRAARSR